MRLLWAVTQGIESARTPHAGEVGVMFAALFADSSVSSGSIMPGEGVSSRSSRNLHVIPARSRGVLQRLEKRAF